VRSLAKHFSAIVFGASGGIGAALVAALQAEPQCGRVIGLGRASTPRIDLEDEASIAAAAAALAGEGRFALMIDATGALTIDGHGPEKRLADLDATRLLRAFAVNAVGPALLAKHFSDLLPRRGRCVFATLSARVGSIDDNRLGGWYGYRASKAALNQLWKCAAIEVARKRPEALLLCLHPGTVATALSRPFVGDDCGDPPSVCAERLLRVIDEADHTAQFLDQNGRTVLW
jgi:NAD(P)-dependent dehydrogenase (short-subunit alcohol dehydrogenase family)